MNTQEREEVLDRVLGQTPAIAETIDSEGDVLFCYLFGSVARGTAGVLSDVDLALYFHPLVPAEDRFYRTIDIAGRLSSMLKTPHVDAVSLNDAPPELAYSVIRDGTVLFCKDELERQRFWVRTVLTYLDRQSVRDLFWHHVASRVKEGSFGGGRSDRSGSAAGAREAP